MQPMHVPEQACALFLDAPKLCTVFECRNGSRADLVFSNTQMLPEQTRAVFSSTLMAAEDTYAKFLTAQAAPFAGLCNSFDLKWFPSRSVQCF